MKISALAAILIIAASYFAPTASAQAPKLVIPKISSLDNPAPPSSAKAEAANRKQLLRQRAKLRRQRAQERRAQEKAVASTAAAPKSPAEATKATPASSPAPAVSPAQSSKAPAVTESPAVNAKANEPQEEKKAEKTETANAPKVENAAPAAAKTEEAKPVAPKPEAPVKLDTLKENEPGGYSITTLLFRTFGALLLIVGLIAASGWGLRRFGLMRQKGKGDDGHSLTVVNTVALGDKKTLQVVKFGERTLLIGSTSQGITLLAEEGYEAEEEAEYVTEYTDEPEPAGYFERELSRASLLTNGFNGRRN